MEMVVILLAVAATAIVLWVLLGDTLKQLDAWARAHVESRRAFTDAPPAEDQPDWESWARRH